MTDNNRTESTDPGWYTEPHQIVAASTETLVKVHAEALTAYTNAGGHKFAATMERVYLMARAELAHRGAYNPADVDAISAAVMDRARAHAKGPTCGTCGNHLGAVSLADHYAAEHPRRRNA